MNDLSTHKAGAQAWPARLLYAIAVCGGLLLIAIMILVSVAVFFRYALVAPILGVQEYIQIGMGLVVMAAMPFATLTDTHIRVDMLDSALGLKGRIISDGFVRLVCCGVLFLLIQKTYDKALDAHKYNDLTNMVEIPVWIAYAGITLGMGLTILVMIGQSIGDIRAWRDRDG